MERRVAAVLCLMPLALSLPTLSDAYGNSEESLNAAIWSLGAKNLLEKGPSASLRGAVVSPHGGTRGDGVYAHHPPLPVWLMALPVALGGSEALARLLGLGCACVSLWLLWRVLGRHFDARAALVGLAAAALSVFALRYGRLFTTLTLATPLFLALVLLRKTGWRLPLIALLVLSSWDGVIAAACVLATSLSPRGRGMKGEGANEPEGSAALPGSTLLHASSPPHPGPLPRGEREAFFASLLVFTVSLAFVAWHLIDATHGVSELIWQFRWRAAGDEVTWAQWAEAQALYLGEGAGPLSLLALFAAPLLTRDRRHLVTLGLLAAPGVLMLLVFRQGAIKHAFWGYNLMLPVAYAAALVASRWPRAAWPVAAQAVLALGVAGYRLNHEHHQNALGALAKALPQRQPVIVLARGAFHPYVSWYAQSRPETVRQTAELAATTGATALVDTGYARELGCAVPGGAQWQIFDRATLESACARRLTAGPP
ncbi:MAG: glycosyltransferase family 39 protein [Archangiaceae bacterium]|nr:glycosyltransferase family 39 protein [Archangiaceae bacterium]